MTSYYSKVTLPDSDKPYPSILEFLVLRFPRVLPETWERRLVEGKIVDEERNPLSLRTAYLPGKRIFYRREVEHEPVIPFEEKILFRNDHLLVASKPHFLPVNPTGPYVAECLQHRLREKTGNDELVPINRIDRETAGIVLFSADKKTRSLYYDLFRTGRITKTYQAVAEYSGDGGETEWTVENRIVKGEPWFRMKSVPGEPNAKSLIKLAEVRGCRARFIMHPVTGKTHQLRLHMSGLGFGIVNDRYYPVLQQQSDDDFEKPLQLIAKEVEFRDPVSGEWMKFASGRELMWSEDGRRED